MDLTRDLYNLNLLAKLMGHLRQFNLTIASITEAILMRISAEHVPVLQSCSTYLKWIASYTFCLFMLIAALMMFVLLVMISLFFVLTFIHLLCLRICW